MAEAHGGIMIDENPFHDHLDKCEHCRNHPFELCPIGAALIVEAAEQQERAAHYVCPICDGGPGNSSSCVCPPST